MLQNMSCTQLLSACESEYVYMLDKSLQSGEEKIFKSDDELTILFLIYLYNN